MTVQGNMAAVREATLANARNVLVRSDQSPRAAEYDASIAIAWYAVEVEVGHERIAVAHLVGRRFAIYLPQIRHEPQLRFDKRRGVYAVERGKRLDRAQPMLPGYILVLTWLSDRNYGRIKNCPGIADFVCWRASDQPATLAPDLVDRIQVVENILCPVAGLSAPKKRKKRRNRSDAEAYDSGDDIVSVRFYDAMKDGDLDRSPENHLLRKVLGLA